MTRILPLNIIARLPYINIILAPGHSTRKASLIVCGTAAYLRATRLAELDVRADMPTAEFHCYLCRHCGWKATYQLYDQQTIRRATLHGLRIGGFWTAVRTRLRAFTDHCGWKKKDRRDRDAAPVCRMRLPAYARAGCETTGNAALALRSAGGAPVCRAMG